MTTLLMGSYAFSDRTSLDSYHLGGPWDTSLSIYEWSNLCWFIGCFCEIVWKQLMLRLLMHNELLMCLLCNFKACSMLLPIAHSWLIGDYHQWLQIKWEKKPQTIKVVIILYLFIWYWWYLLRIDLDILVVVAAIKHAWCPYSVYSPEHKLLERTELKRNQFTESACRCLRVYAKVN